MPGISSALTTGGLWQSCLITILNALVWFWLEPLDKLFPDIHTVNLTEVLCLSSGLTAFLARGSEILSLGVAKLKVAGGAHTPYGGLIDFFY